MAGWIDNLNKKELIALIPEPAVRIRKSSRAVDLIGEDLMKKGLLSRPQEKSANTAKKPAKSVKKASKKAAFKKAVPDLVEPRKPRYKTIGEAIQREIRLLICTDDPKYSSERANLNKEGSQLTFAVVATVTAAIGSSIHTNGAICAPFISWFLLAAASVGRNAFCGLKPKKK